MSKVRISQAKSTVLGTVAMQLEGGVESKTKTGGWGIGDT